MTAHDRVSAKKILERHIFPHELIERLEPRAVRRLRQRDQMRTGAICERDLDPIEST